MAVPRRCGDTVVFSGVLVTFSVWPVSQPLQSVPSAPFRAGVAACCDVCVCDVAAGVQTKDLALVCLSKPDFLTRHAAELVRQWLSQRYPLCSR